MLSATNDSAAGAPGGPIGADDRIASSAGGAERMIIADPAMTRLYALVERLAPADIPVLISGETGCGKELVAIAVHERSRRAARQLVSVNCAALHDALVESELFGHDKGAFSGASTARAGLIEAASGSTLFLDEVGELTLTIQAKLLRVLEAKCITRIGETREREVDVRIVAATNRDLEADVRTGGFRRDLYFRLSAATLHLPPLRERPSELPLLSSAFLDESCRRNHRAGMRLSDDALALLRSYAWPGNVRELKNLMQYVAAAVPGEVVLPEHITERLGVQPPASQTAHAAVATSPAPSRFRPLADEIRDLEIVRIRQALEATHGNQTHAAALLAMPVRTFFMKAKLYGLTPKKRGPAGA